MLEYDYPGKLAVPLDGFGSESELWLRRIQKFETVDKIDGEHPEGLLSIEGWWAVVASMVSMASMASMASMVWLAQGGIDVEVPLVLGGEEWRRMVASMGAEVLTQGH